MTLDIKTAHILGKYEFLPQKIIKILNSKLQNFTTQPDLGKGSTFTPWGSFSTEKPHIKVVRMRDSRSGYGRRTRQPEYLPRNKLP